MSDRAWNSTLPRRRTPLKRTKRVSPVNRRRAAERRQNADQGLRQRIREMDCLLAWRGECAGPTDPAHVKSRGAGGKDEGNLVPLCRLHHTEQHTVGIQTFQERHHLDLEDVARTIQADLEGPC